MAEKMMQFVSIGQNYPDKRTAEERKEDFKEIYSRFTIEKAQEQASRCEQCGIPYCSVGCPVNNNIPDWLRLVAAGRLEDAYHVSQETNSLPEICGRICPQDRLCEGICVLEQSDHDAVTIGAIEKFITDNAWDQGWVKTRCTAAGIGSKRWYYRVRPCRFGGGRSLAPQRISGPCL